MALQKITTTGTNLNTPLIGDLKTASNLYNEKVSPAASSSLVGDIIGLAGNTIKISVEALLKAIIGVVGFATDLIGAVKNEILGFISKLVGRDLGGLSKLSLMEKTNLKKESNSNTDCNFDLSNLGKFGFGGFNLSILGYSLAALLAMLLCKGITGIFSLLGEIVNLGIATVSVVAGAVSDVFSNVFGNNTTEIVNDLAASQFAPGITSNVNNSENMILNFLKKDTSTAKGHTLVSGGNMNNGNLINGGGDKFDKLNNSLNTLTPNWLNDGKDFNLFKIRDNKTISNIASQSVRSKESKPLLNTNNFENKVLSSKEKISLLSKIS